MSTFRQLTYRYMRKTKRIRPLVPALKKCPQKRGVVQKVFIQTPKKPNSAKRKVARVKLSTGRVISCYLPGIGHSIMRHSVMLVRGGRAQDLIGVRYKPIFGKFDLSPPETRKSRRSKYGMKGIKKEAAEATTHVIRKKAASYKRIYGIDRRRQLYKKRRTAARVRIRTNIFRKIDSYLVGR